MSEENLATTQPAFTITQHFLHTIIGFIVWLVGVIVVRVLGANFFTPYSPLLVLMFIVSIPFGCLIQCVMPLLIKQPSKNTLIPISVMVATALMCDGLAIAFTPIYSSDTTIRMTVGGWLLWTFGVQVLVTLVVTGRARNKS